MLVSPAEPSQLKPLGRSSRTTELYGADFLIHSPLFGLVGVQRKELSDLVNSLTDDRISRELIQMKELDWAIWLIEGRESFTSDGQAMWTRTTYTLAQHTGVMLSLIFSGFSVMKTENIQQTYTLLSQLNTWLMKDKHTGLNSRATARGEFGRADNRDWQIHFMQGLPGVGYERAKGIVEYYNGLPLRLTSDLREVDGLGDKTVKRIERVFDHG